MPDELTARYERYNHRQLYTMLMRGSPTQVEELAATWKSMETTIGGLSDSLTADLKRLAHGWDSAAGREFHRRVSLIAGYAKLLAEEFTSIHTGLKVMAGALEDAQRRAENPDAHEHHHHRPADNSVLGLINTVFAGVVGSHLGHQADSVEQSRSRTRMLAVVCALAAEYRVTDYSTWPPRVPQPPQDTPIRRQDVLVAEPVVAQVDTVAVHSGKQHHEVAPQVGVITAATVTPPAGDSSHLNLGTGIAVAGTLALGGAVVAGVANHRSHRNAGERDLLADVTDDDPIGSDGVIRHTGGSQHGSHDLGGLAIVDSADHTASVSQVTQTGLGGHDGHGQDHGYAHGGISLQDGLASHSRDGIIHSGHTGGLADGVTLGGHDSLTHGSHEGLTLHADTSADTVTGLHEGTAGHVGGHDGVNISEAALDGPSELASGASDSGSGSGPAGASDTGGAGADGRSANAVPPGVAPTTPGAGLGAGAAGGAPGGLGGDMSGGARGPDDRRWLTEGRLAWGGEVDDPTSLIQPERPSTEDPDY